MFKVVNVTAVPFHMARLQPMNIVQRSAEIYSNSQNSSQSMSNGVPMLTSIQNNNIPNLRNSNSDTSSSTLKERMIKKRNRVLKNRLAAKVSREKWRLHKDLLEQQLQSLKLEKLRLLLENEELRLKQSLLEKENISLQRSERNPEVDCDVQERALKHASFVNIPLQKEWVRPFIFTILMMTLTEMFNSCQLKQFLTFHSLKTFQILSSSLNSMRPLTFMKNQMFLFALSRKT